MSLEDVVTQLHRLVGIQRRFQPGKAQGDGRVAHARIAQEFARFALVASHQPLTERRVEEHVSVVRAPHQQSFQDVDPVQEIVPGHGLPGHQRVDRVVNLQQRHRVQTGQAHAQDRLEALVGSHAREPQIEVQQEDLR